MKDIGKVRESIVDSAEILFEKYGYEKTSMDEIAKAAHKAKATVYYHFDSKIAIFRAVLEKEMMQVTARLCEIKKEYAGDIKRQLTAYLTERMKLLHGAKVYWNYMNTTYLYGRNEVSETIDSLRRELDKWEYGYFTYICDEGRKCGSLPENISSEAFAKLVLTTLKGVEIQFSVSGDYDALRLAHDSMVELLIFRT